MQVCTGPVRGHLAATAGDIRRGTYALQQLLFGRVAKGEAERAVAVVRQEPVIARLHHHAGGDLDGFVACAGDLEEDLLLAAQNNLAIVDAA